MISIFKTQEEKFEFERLNDNYFNCSSVAKFQVLLTMSLDVHQDFKTSWPHLQPTHNPDYPALGCLKRIFRQCGQAITYCLLLCFVLWQSNSLKKF